jgi:hypothetical protein
MSDFAPSFDVAGWGAPPKAPAEPPRPKLDPFGVDEAFASYTPPFSTEVRPQELILPKPVPPVDDITKTAAARIFTEFCQKQFGFAPDFEHK